MSNETKNWDVYFDNLSVTHYTGPLTEETHYYPFGLTMAGISSKAVGRLENKYKFNGGNELQSGEFSDGSGLELYDAVFRMYDAQIGRFHQSDPIAELSSEWTPYGFVNNNPILLNDPFGLSGDTTHKPNPLPPVVVTPTPSPQPSIVPNVGPAPPSQNSAGAIPLPDLYPVFNLPSPPGTVIPFNGNLPEPVNIPAIRPGIFGTAFLTVALLLTPTSIGLEPLPKLNIRPYPYHGNNKDNWNPHIVYEFSFTPPKNDTRTPILKYGISDEYVNGFDRPESQMQV